MVFMVWWERYCFLSFPFSNVTNCQTIPWEYFNFHFDHSNQIYYNTIVSNNIYQSILLSKQFIPLFVTFIFLNNSYIYILLLLYSTTTLLVIVVYSESNKFHNRMANHHPFSVAFLSVKYWYIIPVQYIPLPLDGEHQILLFNWLEYYKTIHTTWFILIPLSFTLNAIWIGDGSKSM